MNKFIQEKWDKLLAIFTILIFCILFMTVLPLGHDLHFHIYRIGAMAEELKRTSFALPVRILSASYDNYGYGVPLFYGDLLLYIPALFSACGMTPVTAYKLCMVSIFLLTFISMYKMLLRCNTPDNFAFPASVFYGFSTYFLTTLCIRTAIGEASTYIFLPMVFCSFYNLVNTPFAYKNDWLFLSAGMSGLILSHNLTSVFTAAILAVWTLLDFRKIKENKSFGKLILATLAAIGLTASFTFGFLEACMAQEYQIPSNDRYHVESFSEHALELIDFFLPYEIKKAGKIIFHTGWNVEVWHPGAIGIFLTAIIVLDLKTRHKPKNKIMTSVFWISVLLYMGMFVKPLVAFLGNYFSFMQFPWRILVYCAFSFSIYAAYILCRFLDKKWQNKYLVIAIICACYTIGPRYVYQVYLNFQGMEYIKTINPEYYDHYIIEYSPNNGDSLYLPKGVNLHLFEERENTVICNHADIDCDFTRIDEKCYVTIDNNPYSDAKLELPLYYYKGYTCIDQNTKKPMELALSKNGLVEVSLNPNEKADLVIWYKGTLIQKIGDCISTLTIITLILSGIFIYSKRSCRKIHTNSQERCG